MFILTILSSRVKYFSSQCVNIFFVYGFQEFKFNPNAKSFIPSQVPARPLSPVGDNAFYHPPNVSAVPHMHGLPVGFGVSS